MNPRFRWQGAGSLFRRPARVEFDFLPRSRRVKKILLCVAAVVAFLAAGTSSASAETTAPWWHLYYSARPTVLQRVQGEGKTDQVVLTAVDLGDAALSGSGVPVRLEVTLPAGLKALSATAVAGNAGHARDQQNSGPVTCPSATELKASTSPTLTCTFKGTLPPYDVIELKVGVDASGASSGEEVTAHVSGGGGPAASTGLRVAVGEAGEEAVPFGLQDNEIAFEGTNVDPSGEPDTQAGSHPFQFTDTVVLNQVFKQNVGEEIVPAPAALAKDVRVKLPPGLVGNPSPLPRCSLGQFLTRVGEEEDACPAQTAVGVASVLVEEPGHSLFRFTVPLFNLEPSFGEPARLGFYIGVTETPVFIGSSVRGGPGTGEEYAIDGTVENTSQTIGFISSEIAFWGVPSASVHDNSRGWGCLTAARGQGGGCQSVENAHPPAFFTMPTSCTGRPLESSAEIDSWAQADRRKAAGLAPSLEPAPLRAGYELQTLVGCNQLSFEPLVHAEPTTRSASSASGLDFDLGFHDEGLVSEDEAAQSQLNDTVVTLPPGFTIDPSAGVGLAGCTDADFAREAIGSAPGEGCPNEAKLGTVEIETPLLSQKLAGNIFIAQPYENPFGSLVALYIVARNPETGVMIKLEGEVTPCEKAGEDPPGPSGEPIPGAVCQAAGQLFTTFDGNPQLPFDHFDFHFREGQQAPLITPATCGTYTTEALLSPWSEPLRPRLDTSSFEITSGAGGGHHALRASRSTPGSKRGRSTTMRARSARSTCISPGAMPTRRSPVSRRTCRPA
jgi:hypothetical protein